MLRQSSYRGNLSWEQIRTLALEGKGNDPHGYRAEFLQLLDKARGLMPQPVKPALVELISAQPEKTVITSTGPSSFDSTELKAVFTENVKVHHPNFYLECDELEVFMVREDTVKETSAASSTDVTDSGSSTAQVSNIEKFFARGNMVIIEIYQENGRDVQVGKCRNLTYDGKTGMVTLTNWPQVQRGAQMQIANDASTVMTLSPQGVFQSKGRTRTEILQGDDASPKPLGLRKNPEQ